MPETISIFWFRRDLRLDDNHGLYKALQGKVPVLPIFIFDPEILADLPRLDPRVSFIYNQLQDINTILNNDHKRSLAVYHDAPLAIFKMLMKKFEIHTVYINHDYEPYAVKRDEQIGALLEDNKIHFKTYKDQVIFESNEVVKDNGDPYVVYTPFKNKWKSQFKIKEHLPEFHSKKYLHTMYATHDEGFPSIEDLGFKQATNRIDSLDISRSLLNNYEAKRNFPSVNGTSHLGPHLRFGTISIRKVLKKAIQAKNQTFWHELIWREFFMQILWHYPHTVHSAFKKKYDGIQWRNNDSEFELWKQGNTGYALVDAGMRQLNKTGYMHNRVRMLVASFLCKHLLIDWRWGEAYFAEKLIDFELSSNVGNWQWAAGSGVDAAPYFRIFNPMTQLDKFDKKRIYVKEWVPEYGTDSYPDPMVDHKQARERCLQVYKAALN